MKHEINLTITQKDNKLWVMLTYCPINGIGNPKLLFRGTTFSLEKYYESIDLDDSINDVVISYIKVIISSCFDNGIPDKIIRGEYTSYIKKLIIQDNFYRTNKISEGV